MKARPLCVLVDSRARADGRVRPSLLVLIPLALVALATGCPEPPPTCLVLRAPGAPYVQQFTNGTITSDPTSTNCALFGTGDFASASNPGTAVQDTGLCDTAPTTQCYCDAECPDGGSCDFSTTTGSFYPYAGAYTGGFPFRVQLAGVDKFAPASATSPSRVSIAPEIFYGGFDQSGYVIGNLQAENPNAQSLCFVSDFDGGVTGDFDWGGSTGPKTVSLTYSNMVLYETAAIPGSQWTADVTATIAELDGSNPCTATYNVLAFAQATTCMTLVAPCDVNNPCYPLYCISNDGQAPYSDTQVQANLCTSFNPPPGDQMWAYYAANGLPAGFATNPDFDITCDQVTGYCVLPVPTTGAAALPVVGEARP